MVYNNVCHKLLGLVRPVTSAGYYMVFIKVVFIRERLVETTGNDKWFPRYLLDIYLIVWIFSDILSRRQNIKCFLDLTYIFGTFSWSLHIVIIIFLYWTLDIVIMIFWLETFSWSSFWIEYFSSTQNCQKVKL